MPKVNPKAGILIDEYIKEAHAFAQPICKKLRALIHKADPEIIEDWKWGPGFGINDRICGFGAFKKHVHLSFFRGDLMKDPEKLFTGGLHNKHNRVRIS